MWRAGLAGLLTRRPSGHDAVCEAAANACRRPATRRLRAQTIDIDPKESTLHRLPLACLVVVLGLASTLWSPAAQAQGRHRGGRGPVFVGGYFYDPFYGPYPWWGPDAY